MLDIKLIDRDTLLVNDVLTIHVDADLSRQKWEDVIGFYEATYPAELIRSWILENNTFKLPYIEDYETNFNPMLDNDFVRDAPDFGICMFHHAMYSKAKHEISVRCTHILWVIHDLYHAENHCYGEEVSVQDYHEYETHKFAFATTEELGLLDYTWEEQQLFEKIVSEQNETLSNRRENKEDYLLNLSELLPGYEEKMMVEDEEFN